MMPAACCWCASAARAAFMQPGGKRDPGEDDIAALSREIEEELGCGVVAASIRPLGEFDADRRE